MTKPRTARYKHTLAVRALRNAEYVFWEAKKRLNSATHRWEVSLAALNDEQNRKRIAREG